MQYEVMFMRGDHYTVEASSESRAIRQVHEEYPESVAYDILDVKEIRPELSPGGLC